jgi:hypothetical protein
MWTLLAGTVDSHEETSFHIAAPTYNSRLDIKSSIFRMQWQMCCSSTEWLLCYGSRHFLKLCCAMTQKTTILSSWLWNFKHQDINCMKHFFFSRVVLESSYSLYNRAFSYNISTIMLYAVVVSTLLLSHVSTMTSIPKCIHPVLWHEGLFLIYF